jgi:hypothetical protein
VVVDATQPPASRHPAGSSSASSTPRKRDRYDGDKHAASGKSTPVSRWSTQRVKLAMEVRALLCVGVGVR